MGDPEEMLGRDHRPQRLALQPLAGCQILCWPALSGNFEDCLLNLGEGPMGVYCILGHHYHAQSHYSKYLCLS